MTSRTPSEWPEDTGSAPGPVSGADSGADSGAAGRPGASGTGSAPGGPARTLRTRVSAAVMVLAGVVALVAATGELTSGDPGVLDVLLWSALAVLMFGAAAHQWFFEGQNDERSRRIAAVLGPEDVAEVMEFANGEIDAVRRLRVAHPGLSLRDAYDLVKHHGDDQG